MRAAVAGLVLAVLLTACGGGSDAEPTDGVSVVATTSVIGDIVRNSASSDVEIDVLIPPGADPHDFEPSARGRQRIAAADLVVTAGLGLEETLGDTLRSAAEGPLFEMAAAAGSNEPHFWLDVRATAEAVRTLGDRLEELASGAGEPAAEYAERLERLDAEIESIVAAVPDDRRQLVTGHQVLGAFAARYGFEIVGTISGTASTQSEASAAQIARLARLIEENEIPAILVAHREESRVARALAAEVGGDVAVIELPVEALEPERASGASTYEDMMRTVATKIAGALR